MSNDAEIIKSIVNQPLGPLQQAHTRVAKLEARVAQAHYVIGDALDNAQSLDDLRIRVRTAQLTLQEAMREENELPRLS